MILLQIRKEWLSRQTKRERSYNVKISIESKTRIKMIPETKHEKENLDALWKALIRCDADSKVLCPIGSYIASQDEGANFVIQDQ